MNMTTLNTPLPEDLMKLKYKHESLKTLKDIPEWEILKFKQRSEDLPCLIHVIDDDPDAFKGLNLKKIIALNETSISTTEFNSISDDTANFFVKCPSNTILNFILSSKVILVEGAAEYILLEKLYELYTNNNPSIDNINIISVNGLSFERYLEIAQSLKIKVAVITDNDKDYENKIVNKYSKYDSDDNINVFSDTDNSRYTFEVCLFNDNQAYINNNNITQATDKLNYMLNNKSESAYRLLEALEKDTNNFKIPKYIEDAFKWIKN